MPIELVTAFSASSRTGSNGEILAESTFLPTDLNRQNATGSGCHQHWCDENDAEVYGQRFVDCD